jgi:hypothetical protein
MEKICHANFIYGFIALLCFGAEAGPEAFERTAIRQEREQGFALVRPILPRRIFVAP